MDLLARAHSAALRHWFQQDHDLAAGNHRTAQRAGKRAEWFARKLGLRNVQWETSGDRGHGRAWADLADGLRLQYSRLMHSDDSDDIWFEYFFLIRPCPVCGEPDAIWVMDWDPLTSLGQGLARVNHPDHGRVSE